MQTGNGVTQMYLMQCIALRTPSPWFSHENSVETRDSNPILWDYMKTSKICHMHAVGFSTPTSRMSKSHSQFGISTPYSEGSNSQRAVIIYYDKYSRSRDRNVMWQ